MSERKASKKKRAFGEISFHKKPAMKLAGRTVRSVVAWRTSKVVPSSSINKRSGTIARWRVSKAI